MPELSLVALGLALYLPGIDWGLPSLVSWSQDSIAGMRTLGAMETWPEHWKGRYPPLHYMVLSAAYAPVVGHWRATHSASVDDETGRIILAAPQAPKVGLLLFIARVVSVLMGIGAGLVLMRAGALATGDRLAGWLAAMAAMSGAGFVYFAHLGNVDVPSIFWFALSVLAYVRLLGGRRVVDAVMLGLFAALTVCTKDGWAGLYPGMMVVLLAEEGLQHRTAGKGPRAAIAGALWQWRWLAGILAFLAPFAVIQAILWNPQAFISRLDAANWVTGQQKYESFPLLVQTVRQMATAVGWPMTLAFAGSTIYLLVKRTRLALWMLVPGASYYLIVIQSIHFVYERFLFGPIVLLSVLAGLAGAQFLRARRPAPWLGYVLASVVMLPTLAYTVAVDLEMMHDSRYAAEQWFLDNVDRQAGVGAVIGSRPHFRPQYLPRVHELGFVTHAVACRVEAFDAPQPSFLMISSYDEQDFDPLSKLCAEKLRQGTLGYESVARFSPRYLGEERSWIAWAGYGVEPPGKISPVIEVFRRKPE